MEFNNEIKKIEVRIKIKSEKKIQNSQIIIFYIILIIFVYWYYKKTYKKLQKKILLTKGTSDLIIKKKRWKTYWEREKIVAGSVGCEWDLNAVRERKNGLKLK